MKQFNSMQGKHLVIGVGEQHSEISEQVLLQLSQGNADVVYEPTPFNATCSHMAVANMVYHSADYVWVCANDIMETCSADAIGVVEALAKYWPDVVATIIDSTMSLPLI